MELATVGAGAVPSTAIERVERCDLCGGQSFHHLRTWKDLLLFGADEWKLVECQSCKLAFINPRPVSAVMGQFYPDDYAAHCAPPTVPSSWQRRVSARDAKKLGPIARALMKIRQDISWYRMPAWRGDGHVLDIGAGSGGRYLDVLKGLGWTTHAVEPNPNAVAAAKAKGHDAYVGGAEELPFDDKSMDVVTIWHVLEHCHSPQQAFASMHRTLKPGGQLTLAVPNYASAQATLFGRYWWSCDAPRHLFQFTRKTLARYLADAGFTNVNITTRTGSTSWQRAARHAINGVFGTRFQHDSSWLSSAMDPFVALGSMVRFFGMGAELRVTAERPR